MILNISEMFIVPYKTNDRSLLTPVDNLLTNMAYLNHIIDKSLHILNQMRGHDIGNSRKYP